MARSPFALVAVLGLPVVVIAAVMGPTAFDLVFHRRPPERFLVPAGYTGWVRIDFRQKDAPPLPEEDGRRLFKLDEHGALRTSSEPQSGHGKDDYFYYSGDRRTPLSNAGVCKGGMVWKLENVLNERSSMSFARFFVGTEEQFRHEVDPTGKDWPVCER
jgi:hypothetical protein